MLNIVCLWIGRGVLTAITISCLLLLGKTFHLLFRRPWQCIKHLLPWFWRTETDWQEMEQSVKNAKTDTFEPEWKRHVILKRWKCFGIFIDEWHKYWWQPKYHLFIIKKD